MEQGKPLAFATGEVMSTVRKCHGLSEQNLLKPEVVSEDKRGRVELHYVPRGVVGAITPWNFPISMAANKLFPSVITGNTVVIKPSPHTPLTTVMMGEIAAQAFPPGVMNIISGGNDLGRWIVEHPDIVHIRSRMPAWVNYRAFKMLQKKPLLVSTFHGLYSFPIYSKVMSFVDHSIAISKTVENYILENYKLDKNDITVIPRGCDPVEFNNDEINPDDKAKIINELPQIVGKTVLTIPGRITKWKGVAEFIELLSLLDDNYHGLIVGPTAKSKKKYLNKLQNKVSSLNLENKITFTGSRRDIANIYKISDIVFNLSQTPEPFGRTMIEAIACGARVIGWNHGGASEILSELFPEGLVTLNDMNELLNTTKKVAISNSEPKENIFTANRMTNSTINLYQNLIS